MNRHVRLLALSVAVASCVEGAPPGPGAADDVSVRDSSGVRVVDFPSGPERIQSDLVVSATMTFGQEPDEYPFERIIDGAILGDGSVAIADIGSSEIVWIAADGESHVVLARSGQGPGEVRAPLSVHALGSDSLLVEDDGNAKFILFEGTEVSDVFSLHGTEVQAFAFRALAVDGTGRVLMHTSSYRPDDGSGWIPGALVTLDLGGLQIDTVGSYDIARSVPRDTKRNPFAPYGLVNAAQSGFIAGRTDIAELKWMDSEGGLLQIVRWNPIRRAATQADLEAIIERLRVDLPRVNPGMSGDRLEGFIQQQIDRLELDVDEPMPLFLELGHYGSAGVWLTDFSPTATDMLGSEAVTVISADGTRMSRLQFPVRTRVLDVAHGLILGVQADDFDVPTIVLYPYSN